VLLGEPRHLVIVDAFGLGTYAVGLHVEHLPGEIQRVPVRQVPSVGQAHAEDGVSWFADSHVDGDIRLGAGVRLRVDMFRAEQFLCPLLRERLHPVHEFASTVVAPARIAFGILVGQDRACSLQHRFTHEVLGCDEFEGLMLPSRFAGNRVGNFGSTTDSG